MKKLIALLLAALMALSVTACGQEAPNATTPSNSTDPTGSTTSTVPPLQTPAELGEIYKIATYTGSAEALLTARDTVVATLGTAELTNSMLQLYYWLDVYDFLSNFDISGYGLDLTKSLDSQACGENGTWQHYFLGSALASWNYHQALALAAQDEQIPLTPYYQKLLDNIYDELTQSAIDNGFASIDAMIQADVGPGCTADDYYRHRQILYAAQSYGYAKLNTMEFTDEMFDAYFTENEAALAVNGITKSTGDSHMVRHILFQVEQGASDEEWEQCRQKAQNMLDQWLAGEATEDSFAELAMEHSEDPGSCNSGGLYRGLTDMASFLQEFKDWYLDENRQIGDYGLIKTSAGYHIMYYSGTEPIWVYYCREMMIQDELTKIETAAMEKYEAVILYDKILIGEVSLVENK